MSKPNDPAFPFKPPLPTSHREEYGYSGLSKREYLAAMAMQGNMASWTGLISIHDVTRAASLWAAAADALLAELSKTEGRDHE